MHGHISHMETEPLIIVSSDGLDNPGIEFADLRILVIKVSDITTSKNAF